MAAWIELECASVLAHGCNHIIFEYYCIFVFFDDDIHVILVVEIMTIV
jgi:hypothetical protein